MAVKVLLQEVRRAKGLSQNELARLTHMSPQNIQRIEQGEAKSLTFTTLGRLCKVLGCQPGEILIYEDEPDDDDEQKVISEGEELKELDQEIESIDNNPPRKRQRTRSVLTVVPEVPESA